MRCTGALTQLEGYELRPQDVLLPDNDVSSVAVGEEAMEGHWMILRVASNARCWLSFITAIQVRVSWQNALAFRIPRLRISCVNTA
ncbi:Transcriptional regulatory protein tyrR [Kluyvera cryocrescens]|uniref:Transcriptional regulatory protein tyrR n=1 Tax=Kluyvera cryocrescens TaxID=580 RepID=A0A485A4Y6_KLUCR|nr:Transcriptional regulatory protein tyrR [Kluyvera cryocrescens]